MSDDFIAAYLARRRRRDRAMHVAFGLIATGVAINIVVLVGSLAGWW